MRSARHQLNENGDGGGDDSTQVDLTEEQGQDGESFIVLNSPTGTMIKGTVTDEETGEPIEGVSIIAWNDDYRSSTVTDEQGQYELTVPTGADYTVVANGWDVGYSYARVDGVSVEEDEIAVHNTL